jgi:hypothetical protein
VWRGAVTKEQREWNKRMSKERAEARRKLELTESAPYILLEMRHRYRNRRTGKLVPYAQRKGAKIERYQVQVNEKGRVIRQTGFNTDQEVRRTLVPGVIHETGPYQGMIGPALDRTNIMSPSSLKNARKILVKMTGTDPRGERQSFKFDIDAPTVKRRRKVLRSVLLSTILYEMRQRSWRTWYRIDAVDWTKRHYVNKTRVRQMVPMRDVEIVVRVLK